MLKGLRSERRFLIVALIGLITAGALKARKAFKPRLYSGMSSRGAPFVRETGANYVLVGLRFLK